MIPQKGWYSASFEGTATNSLVDSTTGYQAAADGTVAARDFGVAAATCNNTALEIAETLPTTIRSNSSWKFSGAVIASDANKSVWVKDLAELEQCEGCGESRRVVSHSEKFLEQSITPDTHLKTITIPADTLAAFLENIVRREVTTKELHVTSCLKGIEVLPPVSRNVTLEEIVGAISKNVPLMKSLSALQVSGAMNPHGGAMREVASLSTLLSTARQLRRIAFSRCGGVQDIVTQVLSFAKNEAVEHIALEGNDLGLSNGDDERADEIRAAVADLLRASKFLLSLNLAHNNFKSEAISSFFQALLESDTKLTPEDLAEQRANRGEKEDSDPVPIEELIDRALFFGDPNDDENAETEADYSPSLDEEELEQEGEDEEGLWDTDPNASLENDELEDSDGQEEHSEEEEDNAEEEDAAEDGAEDDGTAEQTEEDEKDEEMPFVPDPKEMRRIRRETRDADRNERQGRLGIQTEYLAELAQVAQQLGTIRACRAEEQRKETAEYCARRSGWSHLQSLTLRGNQVGDRGARHLAKVLRPTVALGEEEMGRAEEELRSKVGELVETLRSARNGTVAAEAAAWRALVKSAKAQRRDVARTARVASSRVTVMDPPENGRGDDVDDDDEYQQAAPVVVMTNIEASDSEGDDDDDLGDEEGDDAHRQGSAVGEEDELNGEVREEAEESADWEATVATAALPVPPTKAGMNSLVLLDLGSCGIASRGLEAIADALRESSTLRTLILRNNALGTAGKSAKASATTAEVPVGWAAFCDVLRHNTTLACLDLGYCSLNAHCLFALAAGLACSPSVADLNLEGNHFSRDANVEKSSGSPSPLLAVLQVAAEGTSALKKLNLSHNTIGESLRTEELNALAAASRTVTHLYLTNAGLHGGHVAQWAGAMRERASGSPDIENPASGLEVLHLARNDLAGEEAGLWLGALLALCSSLRELNLSENQTLTSVGLATALRGLPSPCPLRWLSCNNVGLSTASVVGHITRGDRDVEESLGVIPASVMEHLAYLSLSDLNVSGDRAELEAWAALLLQQAPAPHLRYLSLWTRHLPMEEHLPALEGLVDALPRLQFADFGVLARFDMDPDLRDCLGRMERTLVARRVAAVQPLPQ